MIRLFEVGGHVRDHFLGIQSKDVDIAVEANSYEHMRAYVQEHTKKIFVEKPEFFTIRALGHDNLPKDYVLCRKDSAYSDSRRPDSVSIGTIFDDLARRDFTINAMARSLEDGSILDPYNGQAHLKTKELVCVGNTFDRMNEDPLRILRAIRFAITKGFKPNMELRKIFLSCDWAEKLSSVSRERVREEMFKCFKHDSIKTMQFLGRKEMVCEGMLNAIFADDLWLLPTMQEK